MLNAFRCVNCRCSNKRDEYGSPNLGGAREFHSRQALLPAVVLVWLNEHRLSYNGRSAFQEYGQLNVPAAETGKYGWCLACFRFRGSAAHPSSMLGKSILPFCSHVRAVTIVRRPPLPASALHFHAVLSKRQ